MEDKKIYINQSDDMDENNEKNKKILTILIILIIFGGVYYYYGAFKKVPVTKKAEPVIESSKLIKMKSDVVKSAKKENLFIKKLEKSKTLSLEKVKSSPKEELKAAASLNNKELVFSSGKIILPTKKQNIISFAVTAGGKTDPFYDKNAQSEPIDISKGNLKNLPSLIGVSPSFNSYFSQFTYNDKIELKGFIGNKAILRFEEDVQSLKANNFFHGAKIISVNPYSLNVKLRIGKKIYTKTIKDLSNPSS